MDNQDKNLQNIGQDDEPQEQETDTSQDTRVTEQPVAEQKVCENGDSDAPDPVNATGESAAVKAASTLFDMLEIFVFAVIAVLLVFTFCFRLCRVSGSSMNQTLENNEMLVTTDLFYEPKAGDIVVFHLSNNYYREPLVKRVIATEGQTVRINITTGQTYVNGVLIDEDYAYFDVGGYKLNEIQFLFDLDMVTTNHLGQLEFTATVPEGKLFVMGDNRNNSSDSRNVGVSFVDKDTVIGKAIFRLSPFTPLS